MRIKDLRCPECGGRNVVDSGLFDIGTVKLRCVHCYHYFLPEGSPSNRSIENVTNSNVPITLWEPSA